MAANKRSIVDTVVVSSQRQKKRNQVFDDPQNPNGLVRIREENSSNTSQQLNQQVDGQSDLEGSLFYPKLTNYQSLESHYI